MTPAPLTTPEATGIHDTLFRVINASPRAAQQGLWEALSVATRDDVKCGFEMVGHKMKETVKGEDVP